MNRPRVLCHRRSVQLPLRLGSMDRTTHDVPTLPLCLDIEGDHPLGPSNVAGKRCASRVPSGERRPLRLAEELNGAVDLILAVLGRHKRRESQQQSIRKSNEGDGHFLSRGCRCGTRRTRRDGCRLAQICPKSAGAGRVNRGSRCRGDSRGPTAMALNARSNEDVTMDESGL